MYICTYVLAHCYCDAVLANTHTHTCTYPPSCTYFIPLYLAFPYSCSPKKWSIEMFHRLYWQLSYTLLYGMKIYSLKKLDENC